ncbi:polysaccharide biosynthesis protein [Frigidibacter oleivorans]|uniref:polysaccharide biosynthesis protein n=1 Tax=Frigidibacter oleivorans TaxID=2487129 RepID=UPI0013E0B033|nr:polysaccharide biosynthesis protein [Frigidibacter oleivorans]
MTTRRAADLLLVLMLLPLVLPLLGLLAGLALILQGRPVLHVSERMRTPDRAFRLVKLRSMRPERGTGMTGVTGGDKAARITPFGQAIRRLRLDELPQLWNILRGDMGFVGPRPPLRQHVDCAPDLFARVLADRPGLTGAATLRFHAREAAILGACRDAQETDATYRARCLRQKARLDLAYARRRTLARDAAILWLTLAALVRPRRRPALHGPAPRRRTAPGRIGSGRIAPGRTEPGKTPLSLACDTRGMTDAATPPNPFRPNPLRPLPFRARCRKGGRDDAPRPEDLLDRRPDPEPLAGLGPCYRGRSVLVTGAAGSIGTELCRHLIALAPRQLLLLDHSEEALWRLDRALAPLAAAAGLRMTPVLASVTAAPLVQNLLRRQRVDIVLHAAAYKHVPMVEANPVAGLANNVLGTETLLRASLAAGVDRFLLVSSDKAVRPVGVMGASKRLAEMVVQDAALRAAGTRLGIVRFGNVLGSSGSVLPVFVEQVRAGGPLTLTGAGVTRYFMTAPEAAALVLRAASLARGGEVFLFDMGAPLRIDELARRVIRAMGRQPREAGCPAGIELREIGLRPGEKPHEELLISGRPRPAGHPRLFVVEEPCPSQVEVAAMLRDIRAATVRDDDTLAGAVARRLVERQQSGGQSGGRPHRAAVPATAEGAAVGRGPPDPASRNPGSGSGPGAQPPGRAAAERAVGER